VVLDGSLKPEIEGMCINQKSAFKVIVVTIDDKPIRPNASTIRVEKPYLSAHIQNRWVGVNLSGGMDGIINNLSMCPLYPTCT
jgi:hypothetical protein